MPSIGRGGFSRANFRGSVVASHGRTVAQEQFATATPEMGIGFVTNHAYDPNFFGRVRQDDGRIAIVSAATGTKYTVQITPVFTHAEETVTELVTRATITEVNGRKLSHLSVVSIFLENREGRIHVVPGR
jgi:hypothetical protein